MDRVDLSKQLIEQIKIAFEDVQYPGDGALFGNTETEELIGKHWKELPIELIRVQSRLLRLGKKALHFYIPAYLIKIISHPEEMDVLVDDIVYFLSPSPKLAWKTEPIPYLPDFEPKEKAAIRAFFEGYKELFPNGNWKSYPLTNEAIERAIAYWQYYG